MFSSRNKKNVMWTPPLICSYGGSSVHWCSSSLFALWWFPMWHLFCHCSFLISSFFGVSEMLCFVIETFPGCHTLFIFTKTCLYKCDPLKPHFYIVKLGLQGYTLFFIFLPKNIDCGYSKNIDCGFSLEPLFLSRNMKNIRVFYLKIFSFWRWNFLYIWIGVFS